MKRSPLSRSTPLKRTAMQQTRKPLERSRFVQVSKVRWETALRTKRKHRSATSKIKRDSAAWLAAREEVHARSEGLCEARYAKDCTGRGEHLHHVLTRGRGGDNTAANLIHACHRCHSEIHAHPADAQAKGLLASRGAMG